MLISAESLFQTKLIPGFRLLFTFLVADAAEGGIVTSTQPPLPSFNYARDMLRNRLVKDTSFGRTTKPVPGH